MIVRLREINERGIKSGLYKIKYGSVAEWLKALDCKSSTFRFVGSNPTWST